MLRHMLKSPQRGQSLVELAISLTVMLLLLSGAVTFGMALFSYVAIRDAAQEGALFGSFNPNLDSGDPGFQLGEPINRDAICDRVRAASDKPVNLNGFTCTSDSSLTHTGNNINVEATNKDGSNDLACQGSGLDGTPNAVRVTVEFDYPIIMPYVGAITGQKIHLRAPVTDTILEPPCVVP